MQARKSLRLSGQATVEFALVIVILAMILMGIFDLGRIVYTTAALSNAAREGARVAAVTSDANAIRQAVISKGIGLNIQTNQIAITYLKEDGTTTTDRSQATAVRVVISNYPFVAITPFVGRVFGPSQSINLSSSASMTIER
jgi:Flp pilus assembly protein TadG